MPIDFNDQQSEVIKPAETIEFNSAKIRGVYIDDRKYFAIIFYNKLLDGVIVLDDEGEELDFQVKIPKPEFIAMAQAAPVGNTLRKAIKRPLNIWLLAHLGILGSIS